MELIEEAIRESEDISTTTTKKGFRLNNVQVSKQ